MYDANGNPIEGVFVDQDNDGDIDDDDKVINKSPDPKVTMTFGSTFNYKNWDFGFNLRASIGNYVYANVHAERSVLNRTYQNAGLSNLIDSDFYFDGSKTTNNLYMSDYWLRNGSFLRCENIAAEGPAAPAPLRGRAEPVRDYKVQGPRPRSVRRHRQQRVPAPNLFQPWRGCDILMTIKHI